MSGTLIITATSAKSNVLRRLMCGVLFCALGMVTHVDELQAQPPSSRAPGRVLIIRGIFNVFSLGLNELACELSRRGYQVDVAPPSLALLAATTIQEEYRTNPSAGPLVMIGHSLGGRFCCSIPWKWRQKGMKVDLVVILDSNPLTAVADNVDRCVNLYVTNDLGMFHGQNVWAVNPRTQLVNLDMTKVTRPKGVPPVDHFNIDESTWIRELVIEEIDRACGVPHRAGSRAVSSQSPRVWQESAAAARSISRKTPAR